jgi:hypothetical protein
LNPQDIRPYRWYGLFLHTDNQIKYLKKALELGRNNEQRIIIKLSFYYLDSIWCSSHHLKEDLYLGCIDGDKELISKVEHLVSKVKDERYKIHIQEEITYYTNLLNDWIEFKERGI